MATIDFKQPKKIPNMISRLSILASVAFAQSNDIINVGIPWYDTNDRLLQAHGGSVTEVDGTYYLIGENKTTSEENPRGNYFNSVACYSSPDMKTWDFVNDLLVYDESEPDLAAERIIERPKVIYNAATQKWVMWMHVDSSDYQDARAGVATGDSICGDYSYIGSERPEGNIARDMTLFVDDDDVAYLVAEDRDEGTHFFRLSEDFLEIDSNVGTIEFSHTEAVESPAVFKVDGVYYFIGSRLTGWDPNENAYVTATDISGPWSEPQLVAPENSNTCSSQTTFVVQSQSGGFMYMGDRWMENNLDESQYIWLPLNVDAANREASMECVDEWSLSEVGLP